MASSNTWGSTSEWLIKQIASYICREIFMWVTPAPQVPQVWQHNGSCQAFSRHHGTSSSAASNPPLQGRETAVTTVIEVSPADSTAMLRVLYEVLHSFLALCTSWLPSMLLSLTPTMRLVTTPVLVAWYLTTVLRTPTSCGKLSWPSTLLTYSTALQQAGPHRDTLFLHDEWRKDSCLAGRLFWPHNQQPWTQ